MLTREVFYRSFDNRRQIASYVGIAPMPYHAVKPLIVNQPDPDFMYPWMSSPLHSTGIRLDDPLLRAALVISR